MTYYTIQVSNDPDAHVCPITGLSDAVSWQTLHDGQLGSDGEAKRAASELMRGYRFVRVFRGGRDIGRLWYIPPAIPKCQLDLLGDS